ncbi:MAG TPA: hypothetical protein VJ945_06235 [Flavobacteriaceae bacterium]|nr:hypothetical protein [Flavobacteriaceae bacterium]
MKKTSKVKKVQANGTWNSNDGTLYYKYDYEMEDGTALQAMHKSQRPFGIGDDVDYEVTRTHEIYGNSGKVSKPNEFQKGGFKKSGGNGSFALSYAKDLVVADKIDIKQILETADKFKNWLDGKD